MTTSQKLLLGSVLLLAACAGSKYRADVGAVFATVDGEVALQNAGGTLVLGDNQNDVDSDLGLGDTQTAPYLRLQMDKERHRVRAHGFAFDESGSGTLAGDFGGIPAGTAVTTSMDFFAISAAYSYDLLRDEDYRLAVGGQLGFYGLDVAARSPGGREEVSTDVLVPMPYVEAEAFVGQFTFGGNLGLMAADLEDANGRYIDFELYSRLQATDSLEIIAGYRYLLMDAHGTASTRDFDADVTVQGFFLGAGLTF